MNKLFLFLLRKIHQAWTRLKSENPQLRALYYSFANKKSFGKVDQHERMLADGIRMDSYYQAIQKQVQPGETVVDLGTGTGILAFFAAQRKAKKVYAIDHGEVIGFAKKMAHLNNFTNIEFINTHSSLFSPAEKVDVILHEQIGDFLINEDMVKNICDLRDRILKPGGKIIPGLFEMYFEPVELNPGRRTPYLWEHNFHGIDYAPTKDWLKSGNSPLTVPYLYHYLLPGDTKRFLSDPKPILSIDLSTIDPATFPTQLHYFNHFTQTGTLDGFALYFKIIFDQDTFIFNSPLEAPTHWLPSLFRVDPVAVEALDEFAIDLSLPDPTKEEKWTFTHNITQKNSWEGIPA